MNRTATKPSLPDGHAGGSRSSAPTPAGHKPYEEFGPVDWAAAAPSWGSIITGVILPVLGVIAVSMMIDVVFCWAFQQWIVPSWKTPLWLMATVAFPIALVGVVVVGGLVLKISSVERVIAESKKVVFNG